MNKRNNIIISSTYSLKPRFQGRLLRFRDWLIACHYTPNEITLFACFLCLVYAAFLAWPETSNLFLLFLPLFLLVRMALNALDGMVAEHTQNKTAWGSVLNELCDVISDIALFGAFLFVLPVYHYLWTGLILLTLLAEFVSLAIYQASEVRPNLGPFGKSDRAVYLGLMAILYLIFPHNLLLFKIFIVIGFLLASLTIWNRLKSLVKCANNA